MIKELDEFMANIDSLDEQIYDYISEKCEYLKLKHINKYGEYTLYDYTFDEDGEEKRLQKYGKINRVYYSELDNKKGFYVEFNLVDKDTKKEILKNNRWNFTYSCPYTSENYISF